VQVVLLLVAEPVIHTQVSAEALAVLIQVPRTTLLAPGLPTTARHLTKNGGLPGKKKGFVNGLPPGLESREDRGKGLPPGWQNKVSFNARSDEHKGKKDQSPGRELKSDREQEADRDR
jgi:hypothetical protein